MGVFFDPYHGVANIIDLLPCLFEHKINNGG